MARTQSILNDQRGTSLIEFGVAAPVLLLFLTGVADFGRGVSDRHSLQQVVNRSLEMAQVSTRDNNYSYLATEAAAAAGVPAGDAVVEQWLECAGTVKPWADDCNGANPARFVRLTVKRKYTPLFGRMGFWKTSSDGTVTFTAHATLHVR